MAEISVRVLSEEDWELYREMRLRALRESPDAFVATEAEEKEFDEQVWRERMTRADRLVVEDGSTAVGILSVGLDDELYENAAELFGLWVAPELRGEGLAAKLVTAAAQAAGKRGATQLLYWVGTDNVPAVSFASGYGFRPTEHRRAPQTASSGSDGIDEEMAMVLALGR